jgi:T5SS/PEP-CTERM-associated repeat protein
MRSPLPVHGYCRVLTATLRNFSALAAALASVLLITVPAAADEIIDNGDTVTVPSVATPSPWTITGDLYVGDTSAGTLDIGTNGTVANENGYVGYGVGSIGTVTLTGPTATWTNNLELTVGVSGTGTVTATDAIIGSVAGYIAYNSDPMAASRSRTPNGRWGTCSSGSAEPETCRC